MKSHLHHSLMVSAPANQPLAVEYNKALAEVLYMLTDQQLAEVSVNRRTKAVNRPTGSNPDATDLALTKIETEAAIRYNRRDGFSDLLHRILSGSLFLPANASSVAA